MIPTIVWKAFWRIFVYCSLLEDNVCYILLAFICLKMESHWKSNPIGKVRKTCHSSKNWLKRISHKKVDST